MKPHLMIWNSAQTDVWQQQLLDYLDTRPEIKNWFVPFLGTILLVADETQSPSTLSNLIHGRFPTLLLAITPVDSLGTNGWMPQTFWNLIRDPKASGRWPLTSAAHRYTSERLGDPYGNKVEQRQQQSPLGTLGESFEIDKK